MSEKLKNIREIIKAKMLKGLSLKDQRKTLKNGRTLKKLILTDFSIQELMRKYENE